jgi:hypothetical protein
MAFLERFGGFFEGGQGDPKKGRFGIVMELTREQLELIKTASREIEFGRITVSFTGPPSNVVDIVEEKHHRFQRHKTAEPAAPEPVGRRDAGRIVRGRGSPPGL